MRILVADAPLFPRQLAMNPMADAPDATEWLDVQVQEVARPRPFIPLNG
jgi:hypothetical protein